MADDVDEGRAAEQRAAKRERQAIGARIALWRQRAGMTQAELGRPYKMDASRVSRIEHGGGRIDPVIVMAFALTLGAQAAPQSEVEEVVRRLVGGAL